MFHIATGQEIKRGEVTDVYFERTANILKVKGIEHRVTAEIQASSLPLNWPLAVLAGIDEVAYLLEGVRVQVDCLPEGTIFGSGEPVMRITGNYTDFAVLETPILGLLCQASGVATKSARCRIAAGEKILLSFGARRMHPAIAPMIDRAAFIGGCDGVAAVKSARLLGEPPKGTIPHAFILMVGNPVEAFKLFHELISSDVPRVALIDTFGDEKFEAVEAAEALGKDLFAVRLDTPNSRRGDFKGILEEVRWELDLRGFKHVQLFVSGGLDEYRILELVQIADGFGVGTAISNAPVVDFSMDIIEIDGKAVAKRGRRSGVKDLLACERCFRHLILPLGSKVPSCECGGKLLSLFTSLIKDGKVVTALPTPQTIRGNLLKEIEKRALSL